MVDDDFDEDEGGDSLDDGTDRQMERRVSKFDELSPGDDELEGFDDDDFDDEFDDDFEEELEDEYEFENDFGDESRGRSREVAPRGALKITDPDLPLDFDDDDAEPSEAADEKEPEDDLDV